MLKASCTCDSRSRMRLREQLDVLGLYPREQRRIVMQAARSIHKDAKQNIRQQRTIQNQRMAPRKDTRKKRKLLRGITKKLKVYGRGVRRAEVTYSDAISGRIAFRHQHGVPEQWSRSKIHKVCGSPKYKAPASRALAKALNAAGYRHPFPKKRGKGPALKRVSVKWITQNLTMGQAGLVLRTLIRAEGSAKERWEVKPAPRPFLGLNPDDASELINGIAKEKLNQLKRR